MVGKSKGKGKFVGKGKGNEMGKSNADKNKHNADSLSLGSMSDDDPEWEKEEQEMDKASELFWYSEMDSRLRNGPMTPKESHEMRELLPKYSRLSKVMLNFGLQPGTKAAKDLLQHMAMDRKMLPGQQVPLTGVMFSLCKHQVQAGIQVDLKNHQVTGRPTCYCFPATSLMPCGCIHVKKPLASINFWPLSLCPTCSTCARCQGPLGLKKLKKEIKGSVVCVHVRLFLFDGFAVTW